MSEQPSGAGAAAAVFAPMLKKALADMGAELKRMGTLGNMELASAIFNGHAFTQYGPGQYTQQPERGRGW